MEANGREAQHLEGSRLVGWQLYGCLAGRLPEITPELDSPLSVRICPKQKIF
jgi:hypothetical protein